LWDKTWKALLKTILDEGHDVKRPNSDRNIREIIGHSFRLENPRRRLLCDDVRGINIFQCVGQFLWITQGTFNLESIKYYQPRTADQSSDGIKMIGAYGPRLFGIQHLGQIDHLLEVLQQDPTKRRAVASVYLPQFDQHKRKKEEVPCTLNLQYLIRDDRVQSVTYMRSQDAFKVMPYDVFLFTMIQEYVLNQLKPEYDSFVLGPYNHFSGSFHVYEKDIPHIEKVLENESECKEEMPPMPSKNAKLNLIALNRFESILRSMTSARRHGINVDYKTIFKMLEDTQKDAYWRQMGLILIAYSAISTKNKDAFAEATKNMLPLYSELVSAYVKKFDIRF